MPLHLDHRPKTLKRVVGQDATVAALKTVLERDDMPHAFLFHGPSGCGKTTLARIVAKKLGCSEMDLKELNVADVRGIDSIRDITRNMALRPMGGTARVWILDECFPAGTPVATPHGDIPIQDLKVGHLVCSMKQKVDVVTEVFQKEIPLNRVVRIDFSNGKSIFCSDHHQVFTTEGWKFAKDLLCGDFTFSLLRNTMNEKGGGYEEVQADNLRGMSREVEAPPKENMLYSVSECVTGKEESNEAVCLVSEGGYSVLSRQTGKVQSQVLFQGMSSTSKNGESGISEETTQPGSYEKNTTVAQSLLLHGRGEGSGPEAFRKDEKIQCDEFPRNPGEGSTNQGKERDSSCSSEESRGKRVSNSSAEITPYAFGGEMEDGIYSEDGEPPKIDKISVSESLQAGSSTFLDLASGGSRRSNSFIENRFRKRSQKDGVTEFVRVDGVTVYEQGSNDEYFASIVGDTEKSQGFVVMYDISVDGHPSYFAEGIAVHNCHQLSKDAQNALLKPLEDCPAHVYFMLCTTDPQKLIATIRNRCSQFALTLVSDEELTELLSSVAAKEGVKIPESVINSIVAASGGSPRSALVQLDKVKDLDDDEMEKAVSRIDTNASAAIDLCRALLKDKPSWPEIAKVLSNLAGGEPEQIRMAVLGYCNAILLKGKFNGRACLVMECFKDPFYNDGKFRLTLACASSVA